MHVYSENVMHEKMPRLLALHNPSVTTTGEMVYSVWEDGEITLEKGGNLFGQRNLHCIAFGNPSKALPFQEFPEQNSQHGRIFVIDHETALKAQAIVFE